MKFPLSFFYLVLLVLLLGSAPVLFSEETISVDVTADKFQEEAGPVQNTVTVITADEITESGAATIVEVLETVPGIMFRAPLSGPGSEEIVMRGFGENAYGRVLVLVDGNRMNNPDMKSINWNAIALMDIERIEVLDGGASVRYGNSAVAGVINIITKKSGKKATSIALSGGSFWENQEAISHQQSTSWGRFSMSAEHLGSKGYRDRSAYDVTNATLQGTIDFSDRLSLSIRGSFSDLNYQMPGAIYKADYDDDPTTALNWDDEASEYHVSAGIGLEWLLSDNVEIQLPLLYRGLFTEVDMASYFSYTNRNTNTAEAHPMANFNFEIKEMPLNITFGADFYYANVYAGSYPDVKREGSPATDLTINEFNSGYYLVTRFDPFKRVSFNAGARYDFIFVNSEDNDTLKQAFVYEVGTACRPVEQLNIYAKYSTLFRYPFTDEMVETFPVFYVNDDLKPEKGFNIEGGVSASLNKWLTLGANVYYLSLTDEISYNTSIQHNENLDGTRRVGTNVSLSSNPFTFLELLGTYSFVDAEFTDGLYEGKKIPLVPAHQVSGVVTFVLPWNIKIGVNMDYRGTAYQGSDLSNEQPKMDDYFLLGASISYTWIKDNYRLLVLFQGSNLLNITYAPLVTYQDWMNDSGYYPGNGRAFNLSVQYRF